MGERFIELTWRCSSCEHRNLGRHVACQRCGSPKDDSEAYEMPADTSVVPSVVEPQLVRLAEAAPNWTCRYCRSSQRAFDGRCGSCGAFQGDSEESVPSPTPAAEPPDPRAAARASKPPPKPMTAGGCLGCSVLLVGAFAACALLFSACVSMCSGSDGKDAKQGTRPVPRLVASKLPKKRTEFDAFVASAHWQRQIVVDAWQLVSHEGFFDELPTDAVQVRDVGPRIHGTREVFDHDETVYDLVSVPDGYRSERYTESVVCGQDCETTPKKCKEVCETTPKKCREVCTNRRNGFASCREECSGGERSCHDECRGGTTNCTKKYCKETRTRQIPKTRTERRPRTVPRYRDEPIYARGAAYKTWEWVRGRTVQAEGADVLPRWPETGIAPREIYATGAGGSPTAGQKRLTRIEDRSVVVATDDGRSFRYVPTSDEEFATLAPGTKMRVRVWNGRVAILGPR